MAKLDNPAGRLHAVLTRFGAVQAANQSASLISVWQNVLESSSHEAALVDLASAASLIPEIAAAVRRSGHPEQVEVFETFADDWLHMLLAPRTDLFGSPASSVKVSTGGLAVLGGLASFLSATAPEGPIPDAGARGALRDQVASLIEEIVADDTLPADIKRMALDHAYRLAEALDHFRIGGPGAVLAATERLVGSLAIASPEVKQHGVWTRVVTVAGACWTAFTLGGPATQAALESWTEVIKMLPGGG